MTGPAAGALGERVTLQRYALVRDDTGEPDETWSDLGERWAYVEPLTGRESVGALQSRAEVDHRVVVRRDALTRSLTPRDRVARAGRSLDIVHVLDRGPSAAAVELLVSEVV